MITGPFLNGSVLPWLREFFMETAVVFFVSSVVEATGAAFFSAAAFTGGLSSE